MPVDSIKSSTSLTQNIQPMANSGVVIINLMQSFCSLLFIIGLIVGIIYMIKSKKTDGKKFLIGAIIIGVPFVLYLIFTIVKFIMLYNMHM